MECCCFHFTGPASSTGLSAFRLLSFPALSESLGRIMWRGRRSVMNHFAICPGRVAEGDAQYLYKDRQLALVNHFCPKVVLSWPHMYGTGLRMPREDNLV